MVMEYYDGHQAHGVSQKKGIEMDRTERFYKIDQLLNEYAVVSIETLMNELGVSLATFKRDLVYMRDRLYAPIVYDRGASGYRYKQADKNAPKFSLPGLWFNAEEAHALLAMQQLLSNLEPGLLDGHIAPLQARLKAMLGTGDHSADEVEKRIKILHAAKRRLKTENFASVASATLKRKKLKVLHCNRESGQDTDRIISPQRLVYYRDNWYLDTYCHLRKDIRSFSVEALKKVTLLDEPAIDVPEAELKSVLESGYGIFGGKVTNWAVLRFTPERARWVSIEVWHPEQRSRYEPDGSYILEVPYSNDKELIMDILKHGAGVEVLEPKQLVQKTREVLLEALSNYEELKE